MNDDINYAVAEFVNDPDTGKRLPIRYSNEYAELLQAFDDSACKHKETEPLRVKIANRSVQVRDCCKRCGEKVGQAIAQKDKAWVETLPWETSELSESYALERKAEWDALLLTLAKSQNSDRDPVSKLLADYLSSDVWQVKRALVLKRCGSICEGCGEAEATDVHHLNYNHLGDEFLFELVGLCRECQDRITTDSR